MFHQYSEEELRSYCRSKIETLEIWARRLIDEKMKEKYGEDYINYKIDEENYLIKKEIRQYIEKKMNKEPNKYKRFVDTLLLNHIEYFLCNPNFYKDLFKEVLDYSYPNGVDEVITFLKRLEPIRNALSHSNPISVYEAEQATCYSSDFVEGIKKYQKERGNEKMWNVPKIIKITDSLGNVFENLDSNNKKSIIIEQPLYCGETYSINIEIDSSFSSEEYTIEWDTNLFDKEENFKNKTKYIKKFDVKDIGENFSIRCKVISNKEWHKYQDYDDVVDILLTILPSL